jgi:hypothetical protein
MHSPEVPAPDRPAPHEPHYRRQMLPSEFVQRVAPTEEAARERQALRIMLTEIVPHVVREAVASNSRLKSIQMPEVISLKDHAAACTVVFEMLQSDEFVQMLLLSLLQHTLGAMFAVEGVGDLFDAALWSHSAHRVHRT